MKDIGVVIIFLYRDPGKVSTVVLYGRSCFVQYFHLMQSTQHEYTEGLIMVTNLSGPPGEESLH